MRKRQRFSTRGYTYMSYRRRWDIMAYVKNRDKTRAVHTVVGIRRSSVALIKPSY